MSEGPKHPEQVAMPENLVGRRVRIKDTRYTGTVTGPAIEKPRTGGIARTVPGAWFLKIDGKSGEDYRYNTSELEIIE